MELVAAVETALAVVPVATPVMVELSSVQIMELEEQALVVVPVQEEPRPTPRVPVAA